MNNIIQCYMAFHSCYMTVVKPFFIELNRTKSELELKKKVRSRCLNIQ